MLLKSRASPDMLPFGLCSKKILVIRHMNIPLFPTTLSIPSYDIGKSVGLRSYQHPLVIRMDLKEIRIVAAFVWIRVKFIYEFCENFHETSCCTKHENNLNISTTINPSKITTERIFSYTHLNSFNLISQTTVLKNNYVSLFMKFSPFVSV